MTEPANRDVPPQRRQGGRWQFGLAPLVGTLMLLCIPFALWGAFLRANEADQFWLVIMLCAAPLGVTMLMALALSVGRFWRNRRRSRVPLDDETWA